MTKLTIHHACGDAAAQRQHGRPDKIKKMLLFSIPMSICNFRCHYCYLSQRPVHFEGNMPKMLYSPEEVAYAIRPERIGGLAYINLCADGETLLVENIDKYVYEMAKQGHYVEIVTNLTVTKVLDKILQFPKEILEHLTFKCSFHYLELKAKNKLEIFADNVKKIWASGSSANIEVTPSDELIPYINELFEFSEKHFGAKPHLTIARDDRTDGIEYLTKLPMDEYDRIWSRFDSGFWRFKKSIFGKRQTLFCNAGKWSAYIDLSTGEARQCYCGKSLGNVFKNPDAPFPEEPIGRCEISHCYNGHMFLTLGLIPKHNEVYYGEIRNRIKPDGSQWLNPRLLSFFNTKLEESNPPVSLTEKSEVELRIMYRTIRSCLGKVKRFILR